MNEGQDLNDPRVARDRHYEHLHGFVSETQKQTEAKREEIAALKIRRQDLRLAAATTAGNLGLRYLSDSNGYVRITQNGEQEVVLPELVERPEPLAPAAPATPASEDRRRSPAEVKKESFWSKAGEVLLWLLVAVPGFFVGLGLMTIAGFNWKAETWVIWVGAVLGFSVVAGLKLLLSQLWRIVGHAQAVGATFGYKAAIASAATLGGCGLDAHLGAMALRTYMLNRAFRASDVPPYPQLFFLALAITCPLLLASAALTYAKALREPSIEERENARIERERERAEQERRAKLEREEAERSRHRDALAARAQASYDEQVGLAQQKFDALASLEQQRAEEWETLKSHPEFKCLQGLIGQIEVLNAEIADKEKELTSYKISRGYEKSSEFPNGKAAAAAANGTQQSEGPYAL